ncbi:hypothetical protein DH2020_037927 [Rehmannia glutinosa]|uniref:TOG domain-containing protein n=1 Tax=Rehmannia glutinosa TaxID=99300 RepID=A0ABR0V0R0_REHGL
MGHQGPGFETYQLQLLLMSPVARHCRVRGYPRASIMSEIAIRDNKIPESERMNGNSNNGTFLKPQVESFDENAEESQKKEMTLLVGDPIKTDITENSVAVLAISEVEYIESEDLKDVEDVEDCLKFLLSGLGSKDWVSVCDALNNLRRLAIFHKEAIVSMLSDIISLVVKSLKNPRSAVCKTAIMTSADIFKAYNDDIIDSLDPLLVQLLLKSSQDKRFVCEAAESSLVALTSWVSPLLLLPKLQPYLKNRNPRIRAKSSICVSRSVQRLVRTLRCTPSFEGIEAFGIDKLIQMGASQLSDQLPESRDAARTLLLELQSAYEKSHVSEPTVETEEPIIASWEHFCQSKLSPLSAQAVLRVTNTAREGLVSGS